MFTQTILITVKAAALTYNYLIYYQEAENINKLSKISLTNTDQYVIVSTSNESIKNLLREETPMKKRPFFLSAAIVGIFTAALFAGSNAMIKPSSQPPNENRNLYGEEQVIFAPKEPENAVHARPYIKTTGKTDTYLDRQWNMDDINADVVWKELGTELESKKDDDVFVFVLDTGVEFNNEDLTANVTRYEIESGVYGKDFGAGKPGLVDDTKVPINITSKDTSIRTMNSSASYSATYGNVFHGTGIAGIIGAEHNSSGVAGIDPYARIIPINISEPKTAVNGAVDHLGALKYIDQFAESYKTKKNVYPRIIVNTAYGGVNTQKVKVDKDLLSFMASLAAKNNHILFVTGAGNYITDFGETAENSEKWIAPQCFAKSIDVFINVAGHTAERQLWGTLGIGTAFSSAGNKAIVHISAPALDIITPGGRKENSANYNEYRYVTGTSYAGPHVSGAAGILWKLFPQATASQIRELLFRGASLTNNETVHKFGGTDGTTIGNYVRTGFLDLAASINESKNVSGLTSRTISIPVKEITADISSKSLVKGQAATLTTKIFPPTASNKELDWKLSDDTAGTISNNPDGTYSFTAGTVDSVKTVEIYAVAKDSVKTESNKLTIHVSPEEKRVESVTITSNKGEEKNSYTVESGKSLKFLGVIRPSDATYKIARWTVTGLNSVILDQTNPLEPTLITSAGMSGTVQLTFTVDDIASKAVIINITDPNAVESVEIKGGATLKAGSSLTLEGIINPSSAHYNSISWDITAATKGMVTISGTETLTPTISADTEATGTVIVTLNVDGKFATHTINISGNTPTPTPTPTPDGGGGGGGCNAGFAWAGLLLIPLVLMSVRKKEQ